MSNEMEMNVMELENEIETEDFTEESGGSGKVIALAVAGVAGAAALGVAAVKKLKAKKSKDEKPKKKRKKLMWVEVEDEGEEIIDSEAVEVEATEK